LCIIAYPTPQKTKSFVFPIGHLGDLRGVPRSLDHPSWKELKERSETGGASELGDEEKGVLPNSGGLPSKGVQKMVVPGIAQFLNRKR